MSLEIHKIRQKSEFKNTTDIPVRYLSVPVVFVVQIKKIPTKATGTKKIKCLLFIQFFFKYENMDLDFLGWQLKVKKKG